MRGWQISRRRAVAVAVVAVAVLVLVVVAVIASGGNDPSTDEGSVPANGASAAAAPSGEAIDEVSGPAAELTVDELVDLVILAGFEGADARSEIVAEVAEHPFGGVLVGPDNWAGASPGRKLVAAIRESARKGSVGEAAPLIATVQEGGPYRALGDLPPEQREIEIGDIGDPEVAQDWAAEGAKALRDAGFDLNLAPVADVATLDSPIADRSFSDDPAVAAQMTAAAIRGCRGAGIACAPSHFPGLGAVSQDTDDGPASVGFDAATLTSRDLVPFEAAFDAGAEATVVSHAFYGGIDPITPASLSPAVVTDLLRKQVGFEGVAISDDIGAGAIVAVSTPGDAAVKAVAAGIDLVQVADPRKVVAVRKALSAAVAGGTLSEERLREAASRVLELQASVAD